MEPLFLEGVFKEKIWGGNRLKKEYGYNIPSNSTGEYWAISAHSNGPSKIKNGIYKGLQLDVVWEKYPEVFGNQKVDVFPLLTKIIDANDNLSVQVHPDDCYALKHENELGKNECWYVLSAEDNSEIIMGHSANTVKEFQSMVQNGEWNRLLKSVKVKAGDFFLVPSGTVHAIGKGVMILETQQSSDTTYRLYDYDRINSNGNLRELHLKESLEVTTIPHQKSIYKSKEFNQSSAIKTLVSNEYFNVYEWNITENTSFYNDNYYTLVSVIKGSGSLIIENKEYHLNSGSHFIIPNQIKRWSFKGNLKMIASTP